MHPQSTGVFCRVCDAAQRQQPVCRSGFATAKVQINRSAFGAENYTNNGKGTNNSPERGRALLQVPFPRRSSPVPQSLPSGEKGNAERNPLTFLSWARGKDTVPARNRGGSGGEQVLHPPSSGRGSSPTARLGQGGAGAVGAVRACAGPHRGAAGRGTGAAPRMLVLLLSPGPLPRRAALGVGR